LNFSILSNNIAENIWDDRFYTIRIKRTGPSLIVAEVIIPIKNINAVVDQINNRFNKEKFSIEIITTIENKSILMVWFPTDFRHYSLPIIGSIPYTFHWLRSFEIIRIAIQNEGVPYSTGLWLSPYAKIVLKNQLGEFKRLKKQFDPQKIFNPGKVWGTKIPRFYPIIPWFLIVRFIIPIILIFSRILPKKLR
jgi:glycolate oxidase